MKRKPAKLRTPNEAREWLLAQGISAVQFARENGLRESAVKDVLIGRTQGRRGHAHAAAVALGVKAAPERSANAG